MNGKSRFGLLMAIAAIGLASCGGGDTIDSDFSSGDTVSSDTTVESISSSDPDENTSSQEPDDASSSESPDETSSDEPIITEYTWPGEEIAGYVTDYLGYDGDFSIPAPSATLDAGRNYQVELGEIATDFYGTNTYLAIEITVEGDFFAYGEEVKAVEGWYSVPYYEKEGEYILHTEDLELEIYVSAYDEESNETIVDIELSQGKYAYWPEELVASMMDETIGDWSTILPALEDIDMFYEQRTAGDYFYFYVYGDIDSEDYADILLDKGFAVMTFSGSDYYMDPNIDYRVQLTDYESLNMLQIQVYQAAYSFYSYDDAARLDSYADLYFGWEAEAGFQASLPSSSDIDYDLAYLGYGYNSGYILIYYWKWSGASLVDLSELYETNLRKNYGKEWSYSATYGGYIDIASQTALITYEGPSSIGGPSLTVRVTAGDYSA